MTDHTQPAPDSLLIPCVILTVCLCVTITIASITAARMDAARMDAALCRAELAAQP